MDTMRPALRPSPRDAGMTLVELMVTTLLLSAVVLIITTIFFSTARLHTRTARRAELQMESRQGLSLLTTELRQAGTDPGDPPIGIVPIVAGREDLIRLRADLNGDRVIQTTEPSEDVTYSYDSAAKTIVRDPGSGPAVIVRNVTAMTLTYFDSANQPITTLPLSASDAARVRSVGVTVTSVDRDAPPITLKTRVTLRNG